MNAINPGLNSLLAAGKDLRQTDIVLINRGGATDVITSLLNMAWLQDQLPYHLIDYRPVIYAGSAGAYPTYGLVTPSQYDPSRPLYDPREIPDNFERYVGSYLSRNRQEARDCLVEQAGMDVRVNQVLTPVSISSVDITNQMRPAHFRYFPETYMQDEPNFVRPRNHHETESLADAVLASSAYAASLGDYKTRMGTRHIDMAFVEGHAADLSAFSKAHDNVPGRDVICIIFGNNYFDFTMGQQDQMKLAYLKRYFPDAIRSFVHESLVEHCEVLFGSANVVDLSLKIPQDFNKKQEFFLPNAFRKDREAIRTRMDWTRRTLMDSQEHADKIERLGEMIRTRCAPVAAPEFSFPPAPYTGKPFSLKSEETIAPPSRLSMAPEFLVKADPAVRLIGETLEPAVTFTRTKLLPVAGSLLHALAETLSQAWDNSAAWRTRQIDILLPPPAPHRRSGATQSELEENATQPLPRRSSEQHTPSESGCMPL